MEMMVEDQSDSSEFVWVNDTQESGQSHVGVRGTVGLPTGGDDEDGTAVQMQLPDDLAEEVISLYDELDGDFYELYGERLDPNQLFWASGVEVMLNHVEELRDQIGLR